MKEIREVNIFEEIQKIILMVRESEWSRKKINNNWKSYFLSRILLSNLEDVKLKSYCKSHLTKILQCTIAMNQIPVLEFFVQEKWIGKKGVNKWLEFAIANKRIEMVAMLMEYKNQIGGYRSIEEEFQRKFSL